MATILNHPATMATSYLGHQTSEMTQFEDVAAELDGWGHQQLLDPAAFLENVNRDQEPGLEVSDYMCFVDDDEEEYPQNQTSEVPCSDVFPGVNYATGTGVVGLKYQSWSIPPAAGEAGPRDGDGGGSKRKNEEDDAAVAGSSSRKKKIGFRTRSEVDVLDDGYKWRKYGKKAVKNSPNPRNYYKCSYQGCNVKKIVERDNQDPNYVLTIYIESHNHVTPSAAVSRYSTIGSSLQGNSVASSWLSPRDGNLARSTIQFDSLK